MENEIDVVFQEEVLCMQTNSAVNLMSYDYLQLTKNAVELFREIEGFLDSGSPDMAEVLELYENINDMAETAFALTAACNVYGGFSFDETAIRAAIGTYMKSMEERMERFIAGSCGCKTCSCG